MDMALSEATALLRQLIQIQSPYFQEDVVMSFVCGWLREAGLDAYIHTYHEAKVTDFRGKNVVCTLDSGIPGPTVCLNGHLDTVQLCAGWTYPPFEGVVEGDRIYGVGALDMKSGCAAMMLALRALKASGGVRRGKIIATFVSVEEGPFGLGTNALIEDGLLDEIDLSIVAEPSAGFAGVPFPSICLGARGGYSLAIEFFGKAAHAANPEAGVSAAVDAAKAICAIEGIDYPVDEYLGTSNACVIKVEADGGACSVPDYARVGIFRHIVRGESPETIRAQLEQALAGAGLGGSWKITFRAAPSPGSEGYMPYTVAEDDPTVQQLARITAQVAEREPSITYFSSIGDFCYLGTRLGAPCMIFGAAGENAHGPDEYASISSLDATTAVLTQYLADILA